MNRSPGPNLLYLGASAFWKLEAGVRTLSNSCPPTSTNVTRSCAQQASSNNRTGFRARMHHVQSDKANDRSPGYQSFLSWQVALDTMSLLMPRLKSVLAGNTCHELWATPVKPKQNMPKTRPAGRSVRRTHGLVSTQPSFSSVLFRPTACTLETAELWLPSLKPSADRVCPQVPSACETLMNRASCGGRVAKAGPHEAPVTSRLSPQPWPRPFDPSGPFYPS